MKKCIAVLGLALLPILAYADTVALPVFFLKYDAGIGSEENEEDCFSTVKRSLRFF